MTHSCAHCAPELRKALRAIATCSDGVEPHGGFRVLHLRVTKSFAMRACDGYWNPTRLDRALAGVSSAGSALVVGGVARVVCSPGVNSMSCHESIVGEWHSDALKASWVSGTGNLKLFGELPADGHEQDLVQVDGHDVAFGVIGVVFTHKRADSRLAAVPVGSALRVMMNRRVETEAR